MLVDDRTRQKSDETMTNRISTYLAENGVKTHVFGDDNPDGEKYLAWFDRTVLRLDSDEYRRAFWREVNRTGHTIGHVPRTLEGFLREHTCSRNGELGLLFAIGCLTAACYGFWIIRRAINLHLRRCRRGQHYLNERNRRRSLAAERRRVSALRRTANDKPTTEQIREAYQHAHDSPVHALRLGALLQDLECYVDNHPFVNPRTGLITGRAGGIRRYLQREAPDLFDHYKTLMNYKARAKKYRQACQAIDPIPVDALLPLETPPSNSNDIKGTRHPVFPQRPELVDPVSLTEWMNVHGNTDFVRGLSWKREAAERTYSSWNTLQKESLSLAENILSFGDGSLVALDAAIALQIDPACVPEALPEAPRPQNDTRKTRTSHRRHPRKTIHISRRVQDWIIRHRPLLRIRRGVDGGTQ